MKVNGYVVAICLAVVIAALAACTNVPAPKSFTERVAAAYTGITITNDTATILVNAGTIAKADGAKVLEQTRTARESVDIASSIGGQVGEDRLTNALTILRAAQDYLCKDRPTEPNCQFLIARAQP